MVRMKDFFILRTTNKRYETSESALLWQLACRLSHRPF